MVLKNGGSAQDGKRLLEFGAKHGQPFLYRKMVCALSSSLEYFMRYLREVACAQNYPDKELAAPWTKPLELNLASRRR